MPLVLTKVPLVEAYEKTPTSHFIYYLDKRFPNEFMVSMARLKFSSIQHDVHFVSDDPIYSKTDYKAGYALWCGCLMVDKSPQWRVLRFSVRSNQCRPYLHHLSYKWDYVCFPKNQDGDGHNAELAASKQ